MEMPISKRVFVAVGVSAFGLLLHGAYAYVAAGKTPPEWYAWWPMIALPYGLQSCNLIVAYRLYIGLVVPFAILALVVADVYLANLWCSIGKDAMVDQTILYYSEVLGSFSISAAVVLSRAIRSYKDDIKAV